MENQTRTPRPMGATFLSIQYQKNPSDEGKKKLIQTIVNQYTLAGFTWNNQPVDIYKLAFILKLTPEDIMESINSVGQNLQGFANTSQIKKTMQSILALTTQFTIQDKGLINKQISILQEAQGDNYKPFISSTLNQALKLSLDSSANMAKMLDTYTKALNPTKDNPLGMIGATFEHTDDTEDQYLTTEDALTLIQEQDKQNNQLPHKGVHIEDNKTKEAKYSHLFQEHQIANTPACVGPNPGQPSGPDSGHDQEALTPINKGVPELQGPAAKHHEKRKDNRIPGAIEDDGIE